MRILVDMNLTPRWANHLSYSGYETIHWSSIGPATAKDHEIFDYARQHGFIILTNDLDFPQLLAHTKGMAPSVVFLRALQECHAELAGGAVVSLDWSDRPRARVLPLG
jgi:predicted nuclease of predicted toxin-antitoxin system